jgi:hypothetical protein
MLIRVSPGIVGPVFRGVVVLLISGPMKTSVGSMDLKARVQSARLPSNNPPLRPFARVTGLRPIDYPPDYSRTNSASSHPSGVENPATPVFGSVPIGFCLPSRGSIQNPLSCSSEVSLSSLMEISALPPR